MKVLEFPLAFAFVGLAATHGQAIKDPLLPNPLRVSTRLQMLATLEKETVKLGDPIVVRSHVKNVSGNALVRGLQTYQVIVTDASGTEIARTSYGKAQLESNDVSSRVEDMAPGAESPEIRQDLSKMFELVRPGRYFVRVLILAGLGRDNPTDPRLRTNDPKVAAQVPIEVVVSDLIPFTITP